MKEIIIVEDDLALGAGLCRALERYDRKINLCATLREARPQLLHGRPSLVILDINLPDGSGMDLLQEMRESGLKVPVIILTANDTDEDIVKGLDKGADDYISKPFSLAVLRARVEAQLRRGSMHTSSDKIETDGYSFDFDRMEFMREGKNIELSKAEQKLLQLLVSNIGVTMRRSHLIDRIWTDGAEYVDENALSVTVKRLRDKLDASDYIKTVYGIGYIWRRCND